MGGRNNAEENKEEEKQREGEMYSTYCTLYIQYIYGGKDGTVERYSTLGTGTDRERDRKNKESSITIAKRDKRENKEKVYRKDREAHCPKRLRELDNT